MKLQTSQNKFLQNQISEIFLQLGFSQVGFLNSKDAEFPNWIQPWLKKNYHADMKWLENHIPIREKPASIEPFIKSFITLTFPYFTKPPQEWADHNPISNYAWGKDYHKELKKRINKGIVQIKEIYPELESRSFVDSAPLPEKMMAKQSGLGWIGKNSLLISPRLGSYMFLSEIGVNIDFETTPPIKDYCGTCTRCIDLCPTKAIKPNKEIDSNLCISWLTIEKKEDLNTIEESYLDYQIYGCDICQQVCPWNSKLEPIEDSPFQADKKWLGLSLIDFMEMEKEQFEVLKINSPLKRAGLEKLKKNALVIHKG